jgi:pimeloyl-ACP methyl ester carboxylesterase
MPRLTVLGIGLFLAALLLACSDEKAGRPVEQSEAPGTAAPTPAAASAPATAPAAPATATAAVPSAQSLPRFEQGACPFTPTLDPFNVRGVNCGFVVTPEEHEKPSGPTVQLAVAVFRSPSARPGAPPLIWLEGGPGGDSLDGIGPLITGAFARTMLAGHDLVVFDQRGVGYSRPSLACPEIVRAKYELWAQRIDPATEDAAALRARQECRDRLVREGVNLSAYTSAQNAADVNAIRVALGYDKAMLYGASYGTRLALTVMRDFPDTLAGVVLDSTVPVQANLYVEIFASAERAFTTLFSGCAADAGCNAAYPDLARTYSETVARLDADPPTVQIRRPRGGETYDLVLTGRRFTGAIFQALYSTLAIPRLPQAIAAARAGNYEPFVTTVRDLLLYDAVSWGMYYSVQCAEELPFTTPAAVDAALRTVRPEIARSLAGDGLFATCAMWNVHNAPAVENAPVSSPVPALILAGQYDPVTPPSWGRLAAAALPNSTFLEFPGIGHGVAFSASCPLAVLTAFLKDPNARVDGDCTTRMTGPRWVLPRP